MPRSGGRKWGGGGSGRSVSPPPPLRTAAPPRRASPPPRTAPPPRAAPTREVHHHYGKPATTAPAPAAPAQQAPPAVAPKAPGLMAQMAATAGGVAIGSTVGHVVGHALTSGGGSGSENNNQGTAGGGGVGHVPPPGPANYQQYPSGGNPAFIDDRMERAPVDDGSLAALVQKGPCANLLQDLLDCALRSSSFEGCESQLLGLRECASQNHV